FDTQIKIPAGNYSLEATDLGTGLVGVAYGGVAAGETNMVNVSLLGKGSLVVTVLQASGARAADAMVETTQGTYPFDRYQGRADTNGVIRFDNIFEGRYAVCGQFSTATATLYGRSGADVQAGRTNFAQIRLTATGTIRGHFVRADLTSPISFAQVAIGDVGFAPTDDSGAF